MKNNIADIARARNQYNDYINNLKSFPLKYTYNNKSFYGFDDDFRLVKEEKEVSDDKDVTRISLIYKDELLGVEIVATLYEQYGAYEWTVYFKNVSDNDNTGIISNVLTETSFQGKSSTIKGIDGDSILLYTPYSVKLGDEPFVKQCIYGRPTHQVFPYFNLEHGGNGTFIVIGWSGRWKGMFQQKATEVLFEGGLYKINTYLKPGEEIRTPLMSFVCYSGDNEYDAMNLWRKWFFDCNIRKIKGKTFEPQLCGATSWIYGEMTKATDDNQIAAIRSYVDNSIPLTYWWMDAGWYTGPGGSELEHGWPDTGSWTVDRARFPSGMKAISDYAHQNNINTMLWFEPEVIRVPLEQMKVEGLKEEWCLGRAFVGTWLEGSLLDLGNDDARTWLLNKVLHVLEEGNIDLYRQDFNVDPASVWDEADEPMREGYIENRYIQGYLQYWDSIISRFPDMMIDSCASGGGRNDLESMRRSVPLHKTDYDYGNYEIKQAMHMSLFNWLPYFGVIAVDGKTLQTVDKYALRSAYCSWYALHYDVNYENLDWKAVSEIVCEWNKIKDYLNEDYYPLTQWNNTDTQWRGWQFFSPDRQSGYGQMFRSPNCTSENYTAVLYGLDENVDYHIYDSDNRFDFVAPGHELMKNGITFELSERDSSVFFIEKIL